jgi:hypothetical protein
MDPLTRLLMQGAAGAAGGDVLGVEDVFSTWLYTGNGSTQTITNGIDLDGEGGLVWIKNRSGTTFHHLYDTARGAGYRLYTNTTDAQTFHSGLTQFNANGFDLGSATQVNGNGSTYTSWTFRKAEKFFDVVTYTGTGSPRTVAHNLGSVPGVIIVKAYDYTTSWIVHHRSLGAAQVLELDGTNAAATRNDFNSTLPTDSVFSVSNSNNTNRNGTNYVAYLFAHDAGGFGDSGNESVVKCGSYTGNGSSTSPPTVDLGWEPQWILIKESSGIRNWQIVDNMRGLSVDGNTDTKTLNPNLADAEGTFTGGVWITSTGFRPAVAAIGNVSSATYIYIAIRRGPMKTPTDATEVFKALTRTGTGAAGFVTGVGFAPDTLINAEPARLSVSSNLFYDKLRSPLNYLDSTSTTAESSGNSAPLLFTNDGLQLTTGTRANASSSLQLDYYFRRAPGFFDVVAYTGTGTTLNVAHNLGSAPGVIIARRRGGGEWWVYHGSLASSSSYLLLNSTGAVATGGPFQTGTPTSSSFSVQGGSVLNQSGITYIAYLFASCPGVSEVGSYTGTGTTLNIDCGFAAGARFVMIKRTDSTGDWYVWDTARGIGSGNDPYLLLNSTAAEVTSTDYIDPLASGFQITSTAPAAINASGGSFIYLSIA